MDWNLNESNPYSTFPKTMASSHPGLHKERRITHHCVIHWRQSLRIFCKGHSQKTREECSAVTACHFSLSNQFASPERCQITKMQLKKAQKKAFYWDTVWKRRPSQLKSIRRGGRNGHKSLCTHRKASVTPQATARRDLARGRVRPQNPRLAGAEHPGQVGRAPGGRKAPVEGRSCQQPHERARPSCSPASSSSPPPQPRTRHRDHWREPSPLRLATRAREDGLWGKMEKIKSLPSNLEKDRDVSLNAINLHRPKH